MNIFDEFDERFWTVLIFIILIVLCAAGLYAISVRNSKLMDECMADGHKKYECHAMILGGH